MKSRTANAQKCTKRAATKKVSVEKYLTFFLENQLLAIPSRDVVEIIRTQPITFMPKLPPYVKGIINLRGKIVPLIDFRLKFGRQEKEYHDRTGVIIVETSEFHVGLIVDAVNDVTDIGSDQISESPVLSKGYAYAVSGITTLNGQAVMILDIGKVLTESSGAALKARAVPAGESA